MADCTASKAGWVLAPFHQRRASAIERHMEYKYHGILMEIATEFPPGSTEAPGRYGEMARAAHAFASGLALMVLTRFAMGKNRRHAPARRRRHDQEAKTEREEKVAPSLFAPNAWKQALRFDTVDEID